ncbi:unnamed protein product [Cylindrotheca closterium]|uniref:Globin domain-containing protein n=1 Tax=Cylindrotheca closterium TaxID=2856 RepID=A0AAD2FRU0_9STRA|nr:unnamed protein product [Cylindrotheca closterium]
MVVASMSYASTMNVIESWEYVRKLNNYEQVVGVHLFRKFFELAPEALPIFAFGCSSSLEEDFYNSPKLIRHAKLYVVALDKAIGLLGPNFELLQEILMDLGDKHRRFGVSPELFKPMGRAIIETLEELLGDSTFKPAIKASWTECIELLSEGMIETKS